MIKQLVKFNLAQGLSVMYASIKKILNKAGIYHPLQSFYRGIIGFIQKKTYQVQYRKYQGSGFTCNVCGAMYSQFVPDLPAAENASALETNHVIAGYGNNVLCPGCMSTSRERLVIAFLKEKVDLHQRKILHLSPEKNVYHFLKEKGEVITADLVPGFYRSIDGKVQKQDATNFKYADSSFDLVIANHILEHIPDDRKALTEIFRVMKPAATAILQVPYSEKLSETIEDPSVNNPAVQSALYGQKDHVRIYAMDDYVQRLKEAGFMVVVLGDEALKPFLKFAIQPGEQFLHITKPG